MTPVKAIIPVAGFGVRRLPITKAVQKCMLPIGDRPIIDYVVEDCVKAGCHEIIFVVGEEFAQLRQYYGYNQLLERYLEDHEKTLELNAIRSLATKATFRYVIQDQHQPYGTAVPVWLSRSLIKSDESVLVVFGDQFFWNADGTSEIQRFVQRAQASDAQAAMLVTEVPQDQVHLYGIVATADTPGGESYERIVEKPRASDAPSNLANASCFLLRSDFFPFLEKVVMTPSNGERFLIDALNTYAAAGNSIEVIRAKGEFLDCGNTTGWLHANNKILKELSS